MPVAKHQCRPLIVGIGASAGGLAAFKSFLANIPAKPNMAFVLVQHLAPDHKSLLVELLAAKSPLPVITAEQDVKVENNRVYVIPPDATLTIVDGVLVLATPAPARQRRPIDVFFKSLAEDQAERAVGIVLSGVGSDGSVGVRAIKEHGGLTLAQAEFDHHALSGMPSSATATGMVDHVMPVEAMGKRLIDYQTHLNSISHHASSDGTRQDIRDRLAEITSLLHAGVKHDFSGYKETTLVRRLQRRMLVLQIDSVDDYIARLKDETGEAAVLFQEVLIGVTDFFRDPEAFEALKSLVINPMLAAKDPSEQVRIWIAGCSTGEEVYSVAILLKEAMNERTSAGVFDVKIFGTDIDAKAVAAARAGRYRKGAPGLSPERLARWFVKDGGDICPVPEIREMCVFSVHSIVKDPPFSRIDLISCRNLLIYLDNDMQSRVARTFHYALNAGGYLFLGTSESIGRHGNSFDVLDKTNRLLQRNDANKRVLPEFHNPGASLVSHPRINETAAARPASIDDRIEKSVRRVMEQYAPAYFVIDRNHDILRFSGSEARHYLEPSPGVANLHLFGNLQKALRPAVRAAVQRALEAGDTDVTENLAVRIDGRSRAMTLIVEPIIESAGKDRGICVVAFREAAPFTDHIGRDASASAAPPSDDALEKELNATRFQLRAASDELETSIEDMKSTTEEFQAVNEELQSSNEELETAKEEMQSINEELQTVNAELASKNDLLTRLNSDLQNLLDSTQLATVFLDDALRIRHFTPALRGLFPLRDSDRGRPITEIVNLLSYDDLQQDVAEVNASHGVILRDVAMTNGSASYQLRIQPYRTVSGVIDGVVLTFTDITELKQSEAQTSLLATELQHRTGNLIAVIMSIANRTFSGARHIDEARAVFSLRLQAIAKAHALLMVEPGEGGALGEIVRGELASFSDRVAIEGPRLLLTPAATQGFALVIHELATNAAKYGAFANEVGQVSVKWSRTDHAGEEPRLSFRWQERGGPLISEAPTRKGFGSTLLDRAIDTSARPSVFDYAPEGLTFNLNVALSQVCTPGWLTQPRPGVGRAPVAA